MGLTLDQVARETRIGTRMLEAIEKEEFNLLPGGIFSRGFIRSYVERLGLDPEKAVADYERLSNDRESSAMEGLRVTLEQPEKGNRRWYPIAIGILIILIVIFYIVTRRQATTVTASQPPAIVTAPISPPPPPQPTTAEAPPTDVTQAPAPVPPPSPEPTAVGDALTLELSATQETWIKVSADGHTVMAGEVLSSGMTRRFTGQTSITLVVGNAGGIAIKVNDHAIFPLGQNGQVRFLTITPENLKSIIG